MSPRRRRRLHALAAAAALALAQWPAQAGLAIHLDATGLSPAERAAARRLIADAGARLPAALAARIGPLQLGLRDDLPVGVHGRQRGHRIALDRALLAPRLAAPGTPGPPQRDPALAALLHEIAHALDQRLDLSREPRLLDLAGWQVRPRRLGLRNARNPMRDRSPDPYELRAPAEFLAVNLEHFLLDPAYACRRPALHRHLAERLGTPGAAAGGPPCPDALPFVAPATDGVYEPLDPARVFAVEYLLAEPAASPMSRWGHSMLRLVVCAPGRAPGPDCRLDLGHHRVLSFRAFVDDVQVSGWGGLTGRYPSRLFVLPLSQVIDEYTQVELRGLRSVPLRLSPGEIASLLERAAQLHWSYDGRYTFLGNNCATETFKLLHDGVPRLAGQRLASITPTALLRRLERAGVADPAPPEGDDAVRLGYRFPSADAHHAELFAVARERLALPVRDADAWLDLAPAQRRPWLERGDLRASAALLVLEDAALRRAERRARDALQRRLPHGDADARAGRALLDDTLALEGLLIRPARLLDGAPGYGLPQAEERARLAEAAPALAERWRASGERLRWLAEAVLPERHADALRGGQANLELIGARLRALQARATG